MNNYCRSRCFFERLKYFSRLKISRRTSPWSFTVASVDLFTAGKSVRPAVMYRYSVCKVCIMFYARGGILPVGEVKNKRNPLIRVHRGLWWRGLFFIVIVTVMNTTAAMLTLYVCSEYYLRYSIAVMFSFS